MKLNKIILGTSFALASLFAVTANNGVEASTWTARSTNEVVADLEISADGSTTSYTIQYGDTLGVIASAASVDVNDLVAINDIKNANLIFPGTKLSFVTDEATGEVAEVTVEDSATAEATTYDVAEEVVTETAYEAPAATTTVSTVSGSEAAAKEWIAQKESGGSYTAYNAAGGYYGRYQLNSGLVAYGASAAEQEAAADAYVAERYGSWTAAQAFWLANGWY